MIVLYMGSLGEGERDMIVLYMGSLGEWRERDDCALHGKFRGGRER